MFRLLKRCLFTPQLQTTFKPFCTGPVREQSAFPIHPKEQLRTPASYHTYSSAPGPCLSHIPPTRLPDYNMEDLELVMARNSLANPQGAVLILINCQCHCGDYIMKCISKQNKTKQSKTKKNNLGAGQQAAPLKLHSKQRQPESSSAPKRVVCLPITHCPL